MTPLESRGGHLLRASEDVEGEPLERRSTASAAQVALASDALADGSDAAAACQELILEAAAKWSEEEGDYRDDITCMVIKLDALQRTKADSAYVPIAADDKFRSGQQKGANVSHFRDALSVSLSSLAGAHTPFHKLVRLGPRCSSLLKVSYGECVF